MILTEKQQKGLEIALDRYRKGEKVTVISGYAGTGKSTLVRFIISALGVDEETVCYATFTGKAAQVLLKKGNKNVSTLHKLLYQSIPRPDGTFFRRPKPEIDYDIVIVDEVSMAPKELMKLLFTHPAHVICLGDPFQLPPVDKDADNHLLDNPHIFLDEIMRQEAESDIIKLTMMIRNGEAIPYMDTKEVSVLPKDTLNANMLLKANQIIVGTNATRIAVNNQVRQLLGRGNSPEDGDKVICLRNYWDNIADNEDPLVNGTIGYINNSFKSFVKYPYFLGGKTVDVLYADFISDSDANFGKLGLDNKMILTGERCLPQKDLWRISKNPAYGPTIPMEFTYGYAITCHKAQGSEYPKVLVLEEGFPYNKEEHARWLYTAATRASEKLIILR